MDASNRWYWLLQYRESCRSDTTDSRQKSWGNMNEKKTCLHLHCTPHARNSFLALSLPLCHSAFSLDALSFVPLYIHLYGDLSLTWRWEKMDGWSLSIAYLCISMLDCRIRSRSVICYYCYWWQEARGKTVMYFVCRQYHNNNNNNNQERQTIATSSCPLNSKKSHKHVNIMNILEST